MYHVSFFWQQSVSRTGGWSENFWNNLDSKAAVQAQAELLRAAMFQLKGNPAFCPRYRITTVGKFRDTTTILTQQVAGSTVTDAEAADYPTTKIQVKLKSASTFTNQWFGGLRDADVRGGGFWQPTGAATGRINAIFALLTSPARGWNVYVLDPANLAFNIESFDAATGIVVTVGANILNQDKVRIKGVKGIAKANGIWRVTKTADQTYRLQGWVGTAEVFLKSNASMRKQSYIGQPVATCEVVQSTSHKVGKPGGLLGGRRKKRAS